MLLKDAWWSWLYLRMRLYAVLRDEGSAGVHLAKQLVFLTLISNPNFVYAGTRMTVMT